MSKQDYVDGYSRGFDDGYKKAVEMHRKYYYYTYPWWNVTWSASSNSIVGTTDNIKYGSK